MRHRTLLLSALILACAVPASAATITLQTYGSGMGTCVGQTGTLIGTQTITQTDVSQETTLSYGPCGFQFGWGGTGSAAARGVFDQSGLSLGAMALLDGRASTTAEAMAYFTDTVTPLGGDLGSSGYLQFVMTVDGNRDCVNCATGASIDRVFGFLGIANGGVTGTFSASTPLPDGSTTRVLELPVTFGTPTEFTIRLRALADMSGSQEAYILADWLNTATLMQVVLLDVNRQVLADGRIVSASQLTYPAVVAPEPASLLLLGIGVLAAGARRFR